MLYGVPMNLTENSVEKKEVILQIRCSNLETKVRFKRLAASFRNYEELLIYLIDRLEASEAEFERYKPRR